jgi:hypothetical protein
MRTRIGATRRHFHSSLLAKLRGGNQIWREQRSDSATAIGGELSTSAGIALTSNEIETEEAGVRATIVAAKLCATGVVTGATSIDSARVGIAQHRVRSARVGAGHDELQHCDESAPADEHRIPLHPASSVKAINNVASRFILWRAYRRASSLATAQSNAGFHRRTELPVSIQII